MKLGDFGIYSTCLKQLSHAVLNNYDKNPGMIILPLEIIFVCNGGMLAAHFSSTADHFKVFGTVMRSGSFLCGHCFVCFYLSNSNKLLAL